MAIVGRKLNQDSLYQEYDTIFIGSGVSALASAVFLSYLKQKVLVLEQHYTLGGNSHSFKKKGYTWDAGVHYIGEVHDPKSPLKKVFDFLSRGKLKWDFMGEKTETIILDKEVYTLKSSKNQFIKELSRSFPSERENLIAYVELVQEIFQSAPLHFIRRLFPNWIKKILLGKMGAPFYKYLNQTTEEVLNSFFSDEKLRSILASFYGDYGLPPHQSPFSVHACVAGHYLEGGSYPRGGSHRIAQSFLDTLTSQGGQAFTRAKVERIILNNGKATGVRLFTGQIIKAKNVVSSCGYHATINKLLKDHAQNLDQILNIKASPGFFSLYIGLNKETSREDLPIENYWIHPSTNFKENWNTKEIPYLFVSFPSQRDGQHSGPPTISLLCPLDYSQVRKWDQEDSKKRPEEYQKLKSHLEEKCLEIFFKQFPQLKEKVVEVVSGTPLTNKHYTNNTFGEPYGLSPTSERFRCEKISPKSPIKNLYFTGVDLTMGGVAPALSSGILTSLALHPFRMIWLLLKVLN